MTLTVRYPHVFGPRWPEWLGSLAALLAGFGLLHPYHAFESPSFQVLDFWPEEVWGSILMFAGTARLIGLIINGRRKKITPWVRLAGAFMCFMLFLGFSIGLALSGVMSTWPGAWPVLALMEYINMGRATQDARIGYDK
jgi:hypothetical protein